MIGCGEGEGEGEGDGAAAPEPEERGGEAGAVVEGLPGADPFGDVGAGAGLEPPPAGAGRSGAASEGWPGVAAARCTVTVSVRVGLGVAAGATVVTESAWCDEASMTTHAAGSSRSGSNHRAGRGRRTDVIDARETGGSSSGWCTVAGTLTWAASSARQSAQSPRCPATVAWASFPRPPRG